MEIWESVVRMVSALGVVLALILGLLAVARSTIGRRFLPIPGAPLVNILGSTSLGARKQITVVAVGGEVLILGTTATDLIPLGKLTDPDQVKQLLAAASSMNPAHVSGTVDPDNAQEARRASR